ncbi:hypothetical protein P280DRAFT_369115, partial [Massarina eburnea CBS 473.64]
QLQDSVMIGLDMEWWENDKTKITELGISKLASFSSSKGEPLYALRDMTVHHIRLMENAHLVNEMCASHPDKFGFGQTRFQTVDEGRELLEQSFLHKREDGKYRPVLFLGHAIDNDIEAMKQSMGVDVEKQDVIILVLDTQVMAREMKISDHHLMGLKDILDNFGVIKPWYLHNAGNDIALTAVAA